MNKCLSDRPTDWPSISVCNLIRVYVRVSQTIQLMTNDFNIQYELISRYDATHKKTECLNFQPLSGPTFENNNQTESSTFLLVLSREMNS